MSNREVIGQTIDTGKAETYATGAKRNSRFGKGRFDLISPIALARLARKLEDGTKIYGERNWEKGIPLSRFLDAAIRHLYQWAAGMDDEDHLAAAMFNVMALIHTEEAVYAGVLPAELLDIPRHVRLADRLEHLFNAWQQMEGAEDG